MSPVIGVYGSWTLEHVVLGLLILSCVERIFDPCTRAHYMEEWRVEKSPPGHLGYGVVCFLEEKDFCSVYSSKVAANYSKGTVSNGYLSFLRRELNIFQVLRHCWQSTQRFIISFLEGTSYSTYLTISYLFLSEVVDASRIFLSFDIPSLPMCFRLL